MIDTLTDFHFLRPGWLLLLPLLGWLCFRLWRQRRQTTGMETWINRSLLPFLTAGRSQQPSPVPLLLLALVWLLAVVALAGPTWEKRPQPVYQSQSVVVIALDLSPSMLAEDIKPSRIIRAHLKIQDFLSTRKEGLTGLIVYGGEAFVVTPLTSDNRTISNLLPTLIPGILPLPGSNVEMAIDLADELVTAAGHNQASLLLITDDIDSNAIEAIPKRLPDTLDLTILGIGTEAGAPIPHNSDFLKDDNGNIVIAKRNGSQMQALAQRIGGYYLPLQAQSNDIEFFNRHLNQRFGNDARQDRDTGTSDNWYEFGPSLLLLSLPLIALAFRRGWLLVVIFSLGGLGLGAPPLASAAEADSWWDKLWQNADQRGYHHWQQQNYDRAIDNFQDPRWQGSALYRQGQYEAAIDAFARDKSATGDYNRGNALAQSGRIDEAIEAYDQALAKDPELEAAEINKQRLQALQEQQQQQQQQQNANDNQAANQQQDSSGAPSQSQQNQSGEEQAGDQTRQQQAQNQTPEPSQEDGNQPEESKLTEQSPVQEQQALANAESELTPEQQQALQQWLRKVPDDPSGLLRRKFDYEFQKRRKLYQQGEWQLPENNAHKRY